MKFPGEVLRQCRFLAGPTASGKTATGIALAQKVHAEIISLDSMAVYRGMDIGTAKPTPDEQAQVPHHLIDLLEPHEEFTTADFLKRSLEASLAILGRGAVPLFVGGTGLYLRSLLRGVFEGPPADWRYREELESEARQQGPLWLFEQVQRIDAITAARLHPNDQRRLIRALEIYRATGRPPSELQDEQPLPPHERPLHIHWISPPRDWLYERINQRVVSMLSQGLIDEVKELLGRPQGMGQTARQGLGYKEVIDYLEGRIPSIPELRTTIQTRTRQFAKRQLTWFRNLEECQPVEITGRETVDELVNRLI
jgi:tRNA dimethylallyltransferase